MFGSENTNLTESAITKLPFKFKVEGELNDDDIHYQKSVKFSLEKQAKLWHQYQGLVKENTAISAEVADIQHSTKAQALSYVERLAQSASKLGIASLKSQQKLNQIRANHENELDIINLESQQKLDQLSHKFNLKAKQAQEKHVLALGSIGQKFDEKLLQMRTEKPKQERRELDIIDLDI
jgi:hypothetical protein